MVGLKTPSEASTLAPAPPPGSWTPGVFVGAVACILALAGFGYWILEGSFAKWVPASTLAGEPEGHGSPATVAAQTGHDGNAQTPAKKALYQCPMHPYSTSDRPCKCPICGMDLVRMKAAGPAGPPTCLRLQKP